WGRESVSFFAYRKDPFLNADQAQCFRNSKDKDHDQTDGRYPFYHDTVEFLDLEFSVDLHFVFDGFGSHKKSDADTGEDSHNRHQHTVADKIEEIQNAEA